MNVKKNNSTMGDSDDEVKQQVKPFEDVPVINMMKEKIRGVLKTYSKGMLESIESTVKEQQTGAGGEAITSGRTSSQHNLVQGATSNRNRTL